VNVFDAQGSTKRVTDVEDVLDLRVSLAEVIDDLTEVACFSWNKSWSFNWKSTTATGD
jgi:hypothetical protein